MSIPCIVCGTRPHDRAYHEEWRRRHRRWAHLLDSRYPTLRGATALGTPSLGQKRPPKSPAKTDVRVRRRAVVEGSVMHEEGRGFRPRGERSRLERLAGTAAFGRRQWALATRARIREFGRAVPVEGEAL